MATHAAEFYLHTLLKHTMVQWNPQALQMTQNPSHLGYKQHENELVK